MYVTGYGTGSAATYNMQPSTLMILRSTTPAVNRGAVLCRLSLGKGVTTALQLM